MTDASATLEAIALHGPPAVSAMRSSMHTALRHLEGSSTMTHAGRAPPEASAGGQGGWLQGEWGAFRAVPQQALDDAPAADAPQRTASWRRGFSAVSSHVQQHSENSVRALMHSSFSGIRLGPLRNSSAGAVPQAGQSEDEGCTTMQGNSQQQEAGMSASQAATELQDEASTAENRSAGPVEENVFRSGGQATIGEEDACNVASQVVALRLSGCSATECHRKGKTTPD